MKAIGLVFLLCGVLSCGVTKKDEKSSSAKDSQGSCDKKDLSAPSGAASQIVFSISNTNLDPCSINGYIVGLKDLLKVEQSKNERYFINNVPAGDADVIINGAALENSLTLDEKIKDHSLRLKKVKFLAAVVNDQGVIDLPKGGSISGKARLVGQDDQAGIDVYIPGTEYLAKTDSEGNYSLSMVPVGEHNLYFEKDGYYRGQIEAITVESDNTTTIQDLSLVLDTGVEGVLTLAGGAKKYNSRIVPIIIGTTEDAVLMKISEKNDFSDAKWEPLKTTTSYTFATEGEKTLYVKLANANGLESSPFSASISLDDTAPVITEVTTTWNGYDSTPVVVDVTVSDWDLKFIDMVKVCATETFDTSEWTSFTKTMQFKNISSFPSRSLKVQVKDIFGRESTIFKKNIINHPVLSVPRRNLAATSVGTMAFFAGGVTNSNYSDVVDIYNSSTNKWTTAKLSVARMELVATSLGTEAFFAGGTNGNYGSDVVDIYDSSTDKWTTAKLSVGRFRLSATSVGTKAFFAGGSGSNLVSGRLDVIDIYDSLTEKWSTATLSVGRDSLSATSVGTKAIFAGGYDDSHGETLPSNVIDIYDSSTDKWSTATLSYARAYSISTSIGTKAFFAGAYLNNGPHVVGIYDSSTDKWSTSTLSIGRTFLAATSIGTKAFFAGGNTGDGPSKVIDIFDSSTDKWSTATLSVGR